jgi:hypothetical protein
MAASFPSSIYPGQVIPALRSDTPTNSQILGRLAEEMNATQGELGVDPSGASSTVAARFSAVESRATTLETRVGAQFARVANQSMTAVAVTTISWDTENSDAGGWAAVPTTTVTVPATGAGQVSISVRVTGASNWSTGSYVQIVIDGVVWASGPASDGQTSAMTASCSPFVSAGAAISVNVRNGAASAVNAVGQLVVAKVGP